MVHKLVRLKRGFMKDKLSNLFRGWSTHDHCLGSDSSHLWWFEIAEKDCHPVLHLVFRDKLDKSWRTRTNSVKQLQLLYLSSDVNRSLQWYLRYLINKLTFSPEITVRGLSSPTSTSSTYSESASGWRLAVRIKPTRMSSLRTRKRALKKIYTLFKNAVSLNQSFITFGRLWSK